MIPTYLLEYLDWSLVSLLTTDVILTNYLISMPQFSHKVGIMIAPNPKVEPKLQNISYYYYNYAGGDDDKD